MNAYITAETAQIKTMRIGGKDYPVIGTARLTNGQQVPLLDIPMVSDERWQEMARQNAVDNYIRKMNREPESIDHAVEWQRKNVNEMIRQISDKKTGGKHNESEESQGNKSENPREIQPFAERPGQKQDPCYARPARPR